MPESNSNGSVVSHCGQVVLIHLNPHKSASKKMKDLNSTIHGTISASQLNDLRRRFVFPNTS